MNQAIHFTKAWSLAFCLSILVNHAVAESYVIDSLEFPEDMPPEIGALDFASDGMLYISLRRGDIMTAKPQRAFVGNVLPRVFTMVAGCTS